MGANAQTSVPTFTSGQVLTAAQQNESARTGVPVFASTVTRDAAFGGSGEKTLAEGQLAYVEGTGLQSYNGTSWVTWGAAPSSGALVFLTGATFSAVASVSLPNSTFSSTYRNYRIEIDLVGSSVNVQLSMRMRASGSDNTSAEYFGGLIILDGGGVTRVSATDGTSFLLGNTTTQGNAYSFDVLTPQVALATRWSGTTLTRITDTGGGSFGGLFRLTTQFDAMSFIIASGTMTGAYRVYGYADS